MLSFSGSKNRSKPGIEVLKEMLVQAYNVLKPEGRLVVLTTLWKTVW
jgi:23S rRNA G2069 N7-methylase RlmK/C1962 C5-methylase RlmI